MATSILKKQKVYFGIVLCAVFFGLISSFASATPSFEISAQKEPTVSGTAVAPATQNAGGNIIITSQIVDVSGVKSAKIEVKNSSNIIVATVNLYDDGVHNDGAAKDNIYGVEWKIPASFSAGTYKVFIMATDVFGYVSNTEQANFMVIAACVENWTCGAWSVCASGSQTRVCADSNSCGTTANKPAVSQACAAAPVLTSIVVTPSNPTIAAGGTQTFTASPKDQYGNSIAAIVAWSSGTPATGTIVAGTGDFTAVTAGTTVIAATSGAVSGNTVVTVAASCVENWICGAWSACASGSQTRVCVDSNNCGTIISKPLEEQFCLSAIINHPSDGEKYNQGDFVWFDAAAFGGATPYTYKWNSNLAGDFSTEQWPNIDTSLWAVGTHTINVTATDSAGQTSSDSIQINIEPAGTLIVNIDMWQTEFVRDPAWPAWFGAQVSGGSGPFTFKWASDRLAGDFSTEQWANIDVSSWPLGAHNITVTVTDTSTGETATDTTQITIVDMSLQIFNPMEGAAFYFSGDVNFNAMAQGGTQPHSYKWKSNVDGDIGTEQFFQKDNLSLGIHTITVTATDSSVIPLSITKQVHINIIPAPTLTINITSPANNSAFTYNELISFNSTHEGGVWPYAYGWKSNLPDGAIGAVQNFTKNDLSAGNHTITLTVSDKSGQTVAKSINITVNPPAPPTATISGPANNSVFTQFDDTVIFQGSAGVGSAPYAYKWSSSIDGDLGSDESFIKNDLSAGNHTITFSVTDANSNVDSANISLTINARVAPNNAKQLADYPAKIMFLISDENWQDVMGLVPLTTWTAQSGAEYASCKHPYLGAENVCAYPSLIYHKEAENIFDADSIIYFIDQYGPTKIIAVNSLPAELAGVINGKGIIPDIISPSDYLSYWQSYSEAVYVENNYELSLIASTYASLRNAPLIIQGTALDAAGSFAGKKVYTVGSAPCPASAAQCVSFANKQNLEDEYFDSAAPDKVVLVNPNDLSIVLNQSLTTNYCSNANQALYSKASLAAPFLAGAKHELIISTTKQAYGEVDAFLENKITGLRHMPEFLTIIANPDAIDMQYYNVIAYGKYPSTDQWHYAQMNDGDDYLDLAVGRIFGISASDVSGMIARTVFYEEALKNPQNLHVGHGSLYMYDPALVYSYGHVYSTLGYNANVAPDRTVVDDWKNEFYIQYHDHGGTTMAGIVSWQIPNLDNTFILTTACSTCSFQKAKNIGTAGILFCARAVRKGAVGYYGSVDSSSDQDVYSFITDVFTDQLPIGKAFQNSKNLRLAWYPSSGYSNMPYETIIGDPALIINIPANFPPANFAIDEIKQGQVKYKITAPAVKVSIPDDIKNACETPANVKPFYISSAGQCFSYNPMYPSKVSFKIPYIPGFNPTKITSPDAPIGSIKTQNKKYYFVRLDKTAEPYFFSAANETAFTDFDITFTLSE